MRGVNDRGMFVLEERPHPQALVARMAGENREVQPPLEQRVNRAHGVFGRDPDVEGGILRRTASSSGGSQW